MKLRRYREPVFQMIWCQSSAKLPPIEAGVDAGSRQFQDGAAIFGANSNQMTPRKAPE